MVRGDARSNPEGDIQSSPVDSRVLERILKAVCEERLLKLWMNEDRQAYKNTLAMTMMERDDTYLVPKPPSHGHSPSSSPCRYLCLLYRKNASAIVGYELPVATVIARALLAINTKACVVARIT